MDNHPIPQDVTNFQFKLIGDLTLKQFGYLIASVILAWLFLLLPIFFLIKFFFAASTLGLGILLAFVPFEGRPSDLMLMHFIKALFTPNQYVYKIGQDVRAQVGDAHAQKQPEQKPKEENNPTVFLQASPVPITPIQPTTTTSGAAFSNMSSAPVEKLPTPQPATAVQPVAATAPVAATTTDMKAQELEKELTEAKQEEASAQQGSQQATAAHEKVQELEEQLRDVFLQKQDLEKQILELKQQLVQKQQQSVFTPGTAEQPQETAHVLKIPKQLSKSVGLPITPDVPNLLTGIVKDPRGNVLPNILIEVKDKDDNAVRAFKTNGLGQFASATPLLNGLYAVSFEDPQGKQHFDTVEINANGEIMLPIEVISVDQREKLRQQLFG